MKDYKPEWWETDRLCVDCGEPMVLRTNRETEETFWGCSLYPECTYTEPNDSIDDGDNLSD